MPDNVTRGYGTAPDWAVEFATAVWYAEPESEKRHLPRLEWKRDNHRQSGVTKFVGTVISVRAAAGDTPAVRALLLHELTHALLPWDQGHSAAFHRRLFQLGIKHQLVAALLESELWYKRGAIHEAAKLGLVTPEEAADYLLCHRVADAVRPKWQPAVLVARMKAAKHNGDWEQTRAKWVATREGWMVQHAKRAAMRQSLPTCTECNRRGGHTVWCYYRD